MIPKDMLSKTQGLLKSSSKSLLIVTIVYLLFLVFWHWNLNLLRLEILFFLAGGIVGVYFMDLAELFFKNSSVGEGQTKSPFKNVLFQAIFVPFTLFIVTSSGSHFGIGLVLSIFLSTLFRQWQEFQKLGNINDWFWMIKTQFSPRDQQNYLLIMSGIFGFLSLMF